MSCRRSLTLVVLLLLIPPAQVGAEPGPQPGWPESLCPSRVPPDPDCISAAYPAIDVWSVAAILSVRRGGAAAYDRLIPPPFQPPHRRAIGVLMFRLNIPTNPASSIETDPGDGYSEGSIGIRVAFPAAEGFPYREGWWDLAQPLNDPSQYGAGRGIGLPKYMADAAVRRSPDGTWTAHALQWGKRADQEGGPGSATVPGGNALTMQWSAKRPSVSEAQRAGLWRWGQYGDPLFVQRPPHDEPAQQHGPAMVKFTPTALLPLYDTPRTPLTEYADPVIGTVRVRLNGMIPGSGSRVSAMPFSRILAPGVHVVPGTLAFARGHAFLTIDNLENNRA